MNEAFQTINYVLSHCIVVLPYLLTSSVPALCVITVMILFFCYYHMTKIISEIWTLFFFHGGLLYAQWRSEDDVTELSDPFKTRVVIPNKIKKIPVISDIFCFLYSVYYESVDARWQWDRSHHLELDKSHVEDPEGIDEYSKDIPKCHISLVGDQHLIVQNDAYGISLILFIYLIYVFFYEYLFSFLYLGA